MVRHPGARRFGLDPGTVAAWERGEMARTYSRIWWIFERWFASMEAKGTGYRIGGSSAGTRQ